VPTKPNRLVTPFSSISDFAFSQAGDGGRHHSQQRRALANQEVGLGRLGGRKRQAGRGGGACGRAQEGSARNVKTVGRFEGMAVSCRCKVYGEPMFRAAGHAV
jgi:hypothetical protein